MDGFGEAGHRGLVEAQSGRSMGVSAMHGEASLKALSCGSLHQSRGHPKVASL